VVFSACRYRELWTATGGGDVGKTTILDALALLLHPTNTYPLSGADYWQRKVDSEFVIEAVGSLEGVAAISQASEMNWPWQWDGDQTVLPSEDNPDDADNTESGDPVHRLRVRGTMELETVYEVVQPNLTVTNFSVGLRRAIGLIRLAWVPAALHATRGRHPQGMLRKEGPFGPSVELLVI